MRIENYLGFPTGITGGELAERAVVQANKFGADLPVPTPVVGLTFDDGCPVLHLDGGEAVKARCLLIATGADYRRLGRRGVRAVRGPGGLLRRDARTRRSMCRGSEVVVVGGGNSAGQAAVFLAGQVRKVYLVVRGDDLAKDMSELPGPADRADPQRRGPLQHRGPADARRRLPRRGRAWPTTRRARRGRCGSPALFSFIGAVPRTDWLPPEIERDGKGFVRTGPDLAALRPLGLASGRRSSWRPAAPASSPPGTCGPARSSGSPRPSARGRWRSSSSTNT